MSAQAHPDSRFERTPGALVALWLVALGCLALAALLMSLGRASGSSFQPDLHGWLLTAGAALLLPVPFFTLDRLQAQRRVWLGRLAPRSIWHTLLAEHRRDLLASLAVVALPLMAWRFLGRPDAEAWPQTALAVALTLAVLAAVLGTTLITAAGLSSILDTRWAALGAIGLAAVLAGGPGMAVQVTEWGGWAGDSAGNATGQVAALGATWMMLGVALPLLALRHIEGRLAVLRITLAGAPASWWARLAALGNRWNERWRLLDGPAQAGSLWGVLPQLPVNLLGNSPETRYLQPWGSTVTAGHGVRLAVMVLLAGACLRCIDMHWRVHLLPGGADRRRLGLRIIGSTLVTVLLACIVVLTATGVVVNLFLPRLAGGGWAEWPTLAASYGPPFMADLCLSVALAAWLRAHMGAPGVRAWTIAWIAVGLLAALALWAKHSNWPPLWTRGVRHHAIEFAVAGLFAWLANRAWRSADLGELLRRSASAKNKP